MRKVNRAHFFATITSGLKPLHYKLSDLQKAGYENILSHWDQEVEMEDDRHLAYMLATTFHETAMTIQPIKERGGNKYYVKMYWDNVKVRNQLGNLSPQDAIDFCGNGYTMITGRRNYTLFGDLLGLPLVAHPEKAREPETACVIMFTGMQLGKFTSKKLGDYIHGDVCDFVNARRIINGVDRKNEIAEYATKFLEAISYLTK